LVCLPPPFPEEGISDYIAHGRFIRVFTVVSFVTHYQSRGGTDIPCWYIIGRFAYMAGDGRIGNRGGNRWIDQNA